MIAKALLTGFALAALAMAQGGGGGGGRGQSNTSGEGGGMPGMSMPKQKETKAEMMVNRLKLNKEQQQEVQDIMLAVSKEAAPVVATLLLTRNQVATAMVTGKTAAEIEPLQKQMVDAQWQMTGVEVRAFQKVVEVLKPNQLSKAPEAFDVMAGIFLPTGGGRGGGGGRGMGRGRGGQ